MGEITKKMIKPSSFMYALDRPCESGERAIGMCNRNKNSVREHSTQRRTHAITPYKKHRRKKRRIEETKCVCVCVYRDKKKDRKIDRRQARKKKEQTAIDKETAYRPD